MAQVVHKFALEVDMDLPFGAKILHVAIQDNKPYIWALVRSNVEMMTRKFAILATGTLADLDNATYIGTYNYSNYKDVYHVFELH